MPHPDERPELDREVAALKERFVALRQAAALRGADPAAVLEAAFAELDAAVAALGALSARPAGAARAPSSPPDALIAERRLLRAVFQDAPVPLFLLGLDGTVHRVNASASELLGTRPGYATGKLFTAFLDLPSRAATRSQLAAVARTGRTRRIQCRLLGPDGPVDTQLTAALARLRGDTDQLVVVALPAAIAPAAAPAAAPGRSGARPAPGGRPGESAPSPGVVEATMRRYDLATSAARLLLESAVHGEPVTLQRCARLLAGELAAWVIVDVERGQRLRREFVTGPAEQAADVAQAVSQVDPEPGTAPQQVYDSASSQLIAHAEDAGILGTGPAGVPVMMMLDATSVLCVPLSDGERSYGTLTLARPASGGHFDLADLGLVEELGEQLGLAIRSGRMFRRYTEIADALWSGLLPRELPQMPGVEIAAACIAATDGLGVAGDFYDAYRTPGGWGVSIGDVSGKGEDAAAVSAAARQSIRALAHWFADPAEVLDKANELLLDGDLGDRFVTAQAAHLRWRGQRLHVVLGSAGHPGPVRLQPDGRTRMLPLGGLPLGLFPQVAAGRAEIELPPGDVLFFFTDGVTEARSRELGYFASRLSGDLAALAGQAAGDIVARMRSLVLEFCQDELRDDMTMLALRVTGPPGR
jgi:serine phosphatase RsbU (regulator of sigma subunit)/PAS domain-containing protein